MVSVGGYASLGGLEFFLSLTLTLLDFSGFSPRSAAATGSLNHPVMTATSQQTTAEMSVREPGQKSGKSKPSLIHTANSGELEC